MDVDGDSPERPKMARRGMSPQRLLETMIPGYWLISEFFELLSIDITSYVAWIAVLVGGFYGLRYVYNGYRAAARKVIQYLACSAEVPPVDEMYTMVLRWLDGQNLSGESRHFTATTSKRQNMHQRRHFGRRYSDSEESEEDEVDITMFNEDDPQFWQEINAKKKTPPLQFSFPLGNTLFYFKGRWFYLMRQSRQEDSYPYREHDTVSGFVIWCLGRNPQPLKDLLNEIRRTQIPRNGKRTEIYRTGRRMDYGNWMKCMSRSPRPLDTVVIDPAQKHALLEDMKAYLHPTTRQFYASRGIPYRRGYLLHGPPGTGKSSLSFALAGVFGLRLYIVSLSSVLDTYSLTSLFESLPRHCIVLLEDIDTAGIERRDKSDSEAESKKSDSESDSGSDSGHSSSDSYRSRRHRRRPRYDMMPLSNLLNVIDGVTSQEGRILIMTTNHIEKLDEALIRPGRIDMVIKFEYADSQTVASLFRAMYLPSVNPLLPAKSLLTTGDANGKPKPTANKSSSGVLTPPPTPDLKNGSRFVISHSLSEAEIGELAEEMAKAVPPNSLSPAAIQGYLLKHRSDPKAAVAQSKAWAAEVMAERAQKNTAKEKKPKRKPKKKKKSRARSSRIIIDD